MNKKFIMSIVVLCCLSLLSTGLIQPIQTAQAMETRSNLPINNETLNAIVANLYIDVQQVSENMYIVTVDNSTATFEYFENGYRISATSDDGEITTFEIIKELREVNDVTLESSSENDVFIEEVRFMNGTEISKRSLNQTDPLTIEYPDELLNSRGTVYYMWDGVYFVEETGILGYLFNYAHPDRNAYYIDSAENSYVIGNNLLHYQLSAANSQNLFIIPSEIIGLVLSVAAFLAFGLVIPHPLDLIVSSVIAGVIGWFALDEENCLWWWTSVEFIDNIYVNTWFLDFMLNQGMYGEVATLVHTWFYDTGYFRLGHITYRDPRHIGNPHAVPPYYYAQSATKSSTGNGYVNNKDDILLDPDLYCAYLNSGSFGNKAEITAILSNAPISGTLYLKCHTPSSNGANLKVYVGNQYGVWTQVKNTNLYPPNVPITVNCGYVGSIVKVSVVAYHEYSGYPSYIYADAVWVEP